MAPLENVLNILLEMGSSLLKFEKYTESHYTQISYLTYSANPYSPSNTGAININLRYKNDNKL